MSALRRTRSRARIRSSFASLMFIERLESRVLLDSTLIPMPSSNNFKIWDFIYDPKRERVYITHGTGQVDRYDLASRQFLTPWNFGIGVHRGDISADYNTVYFSDSGAHLIHSINLETNTLKDYPTQGGTNSVAAMADGSVIFNQGYYDNGGYVFRLNPSTGAITTIGGSGGMQTPIAKDVLHLRAAVRVLQSPPMVGIISNGQIASEHNITLSDELLGVSFDGSLIGYIAGDREHGNVTFITSSNQLLFGTRGNGFTFDSQRNIAYVATWGSTTIKMFDPITSTVLKNLDLVDAFIDHNFYYGSGVGLMQTSPDGGRLFVSTPAGIRVIDIPTSWTSTATLDPVPDGKASQQVSLVCRVAGTSTQSGSVVPTGMVRFLEGNTVIGTAPLVGGIATLKSQLSSGSHSITAVYDGDEHFVTSNASAVDFNLVATPTTITNSSSVLSVAYGMPKSLFATVNDAQGSPVTVGQVALRDQASGLVVDTQPLDSAGRARFTISGQIIGEFPFVTEYVAVDPYGASVSAPFTVSVSRASPMINLTRLSRKLLVSVLLPGSQSAAPAFGTVTLLDNGSASATIPLTSGNAEFDLSQFPLGNHALQVQYSGDARYLPASSQALQYAVTSAPATRIALAASNYVPTPGLSFTLTATISGASSNHGPLLGSVTFFAGDEPLASAPVVNGKATASVSLPQIGYQAIHAVFSPTSDYQPSVSSPITVQVQVAPVIDLLAVYTAEAAAAAGGRDNVLSQLNEQIDQANEVFANSLIPLTLRLVTLAWTSYEESGNIPKDLQRMTKARDGYLDEVLMWRDMLAADLVLLIDSQGTYSPQGYIQGAATVLLDPSSSKRSQAAFMVIDQGASLSDYVLVHEMGHTLGIAHAAGDPGGPGSAPYARGYRFRDLEGDLYHDVMAYYPGEVIPYFSNPDITYNNVPIGVPGKANAALAVRQNAPLVAAYRTAKPAGGIEKLSLSQLAGYALDPRTDEPISVRIDIDGKTVATFLADEAREAQSAVIGLPIHGFTYNLPLLSQGKHTINVYGIDPVTNQAVLISSGKLDAPTPLFDEAFYLLRNTDVADLVAAGKFKSAWDHFSRVGQYEGRDPSAYFNTSYYLAMNAEVAQAIRRKTVRSAFQHFMNTGQKKGLAASALFDEKYYVAANPGVAADIAKRKYRSGLEEFLLVGRLAGASPLPPVTAG